MRTFVFCFLMVMTINNLSSQSIFKLNKEVNYSNLDEYGSTLTKYQQELEYQKNSSKVNISPVRYSFYPMAELRTKAQRKNKAKKFRLSFEDWDMGIADNDLLFKRLTLQTKITDFRLVIYIHSYAHDFIPSRKLFHEEISTRLFGKDNLPLASYYENIGNMYYNKYNYTQALFWYKKALLERKRIAKPSNSVEPVSSHLKIANTYLCKGEYDKAISHFNEFYIPIDKIVENIEHIYDYGHFINGTLSHTLKNSNEFTIANVYGIAGNYEKADSIWKALLPEWIEGLRIGSMGNRFFNENGMNFTYENFTNPFYWFATTYQDTATLELAANLHINVKSIFLDAEKIHKAIRKAEKKKYYQLQNKLDLKTLIVNMEKIHKTIKKEGSKEYYKQVIYKQIKWKNLEEQLSPNHAIIDFLSFSNDPTECGLIDSPHILYAILIRKDFSSPKFIRITDEKVLSELVDREDYFKVTSVRKKLYQEIWEPIEPYLEGINTIHLSPIGKLNKIAFDAIQDTENYLGDRYQFHYYSAIRDLIDENRIEDYQNIALFGGIQYNLTQKDSIRIALKKNISLIFPNRRSIRDDLPELEFAKEEINEINTICKVTGRNAIILTGKYPTEDTMQHLSGVEAPDILHFATHGIFLPKIDNKSTHPITASMKDHLYTADNPLMRSAIMLYGANETWKKGGNVFGHREDGILTAKEVIELDLQKTNLVVLSACKTALGDVDNIEGVFGLQRAFKLAGVDNVIASLWNVDDEVTKELMVRFYTNLLEKKMEVATALREAKKSMREDDYQPEDWAGFILIE